MVLSPINIYIMTLYLHVSLVDYDCHPSHMTSHMTPPHPAAPEAPPTDIVAEAYNVDSIRLVWGPPPADLQNGPISSYLVRYHSLLDQGDQGTEEVAPQDGLTIEFIISGLLRTDTRYNITVAAVTVAVGPFSGGVVQQTYPEPPVISAEPPSTAGSVTQTVIPIRLPDIDTPEFRYVCVCLSA